MSNDAIKQEIRKLDDAKKQIFDDYRKIDKLESRKYLQVVSLLLGIMILVMLYIILAL